MARSASPPPPACLLFVSIAELFRKRPRLPMSPAPRALRRWIELSSALAPSPHSPSTPRPTIAPTPIFHPRCPPRRPRLPSHARSAPPDVPVRPHRTPRASRLSRGRSFSALYKQSAPHTTAAQPPPHA